VLVQFTVVVTATLAVQFLFEHSRLPGIVGLLLLGMLLGPGGTTVLPEEPVVELLGSIGLLYIMFLARLEIDLDVVRRRTRDVAAFGGLAFVLSLVPAVVAGVWLGMGWAGALLLGAALSSHTLLSYPVVEKLGLVHRRAIVATIGGTLLTDTMVLVLLAVVIQQPSGESGGTFGWLTPLALLALLAAVSLVVVPRLVRRILDDRSITLAEQSLLMIPCCCCFPSPPRRSAPRTSSAPSWPGFASTESSIAGRNCAITSSSSVACCSRPSSSWTRGCASSWGYSPAEWTLGCLPACC
jgi:Kef-type K+ transport system membrane component KefB